MPINSDGEGTCHYTHARDKIRSRPRYLEPANSRGEYQISVSKSRSEVMAESTSFGLGDRFNSFIEDQVANGRHGSASDVVRVCLRLLEEPEARLAILRPAAKIEIHDAHGFGPEPCFGAVMQAGHGKVALRTNRRHGARRSPRPDPSHLVRVSVCPAEVEVGLLGSDFAGKDARRRAQSAF